jgi:hypothetical protein
MDGRMRIFSSEYELQGYLQATLEEIAEKYDATLTISHETRKAEFDVDVEKEADLVKDVMMELGSFATD